MSRFTRPRSRIPSSVFSLAERGESTLVADESLVDLRCSVVVVRGTDILLLHRSATPDDPDDGDWVLPGGRPRPGESMVACARRETVEETGLDVIVQRCLFVLEVSSPPPGGGRVVELVFQALAPQNGDPSPRETHRYAQFVPLDTIHLLHLRPPVAGHLRGLRSDRPTGAAYLGNLWRPGSVQDEGRP